MLVSVLELMNCRLENDELRGRKRRFPPRKTMSYASELTLFKTESQLLE